MRNEYPCLADNLRLLLAKRKITARELNDALNLPGTDRIHYIIYYAQRINVKADEVEQIANFFKISVEELTTKEADIIFK